MQVNFPHATARRRSTAGAENLDRCQANTSSNQTRSGERHDDYGNHVGQRAESKNPGDRDEDRPEAELHPSYCLFSTLPSVRVIIVWDENYLDGPVSGWRLMRRPFRFFVFRRDRTAGYADIPSCP